MKLHILKKNNVRVLDSISVVLPPKFQKLFFLARLPVTLLHMLLLLIFLIDIITYRL